MLNMFKAKPDPKEQIRASKRELTKGVRDLDKEMVMLKREEAKLVLEIKQAAKVGNTPTVRVLAKALIRSRAQMTQLQGSAAQLRGISSTITTSAATSTVASAMGSATRAMQAVQGAQDPARMAAQMRQFAMQNEKMQMAQEMVGDTMDDAMDNDETEGDADELVGQVLDEIGIDISAGLKSAPKTRVAQPVAAAAEAQPNDDLAARMAALRS